MGEQKTGRDVSPKRPLILRGGHFWTPCETMAAKIAALQTRTARRAVPTARKLRCYSKNLSVAKRGMDTAAFQKIMRHVWLVIFLSLLATLRSGATITIQFDYTYDISNFFGSVNST